MQKQEYSIILNGMLTMEGLTERTSQEVLHATVEKSWLEEVNKIAIGYNEQKHEEDEWVCALFKFSNSNPTNPGVRPDQWGTETYDSDEIIARRTTTRTGAALVSWGNALKGAGNYITSMFKKQNPKYSASNQVYGTTGNQVGDPSKVNAKLMLLKMLVKDSYTGRDKNIPKDLVDEDAWEEQGLGTYESLLVFADSSCMITQASKNFNIKYLYEVWMIYGPMGSNVAFFGHGIVEQQQGREVGAGVTPGSVNAKGEMNTPLPRPGSGAQVVAGKETASAQVKTNEQFMAAAQNARVECKRVEVDGNVTQTKLNVKRRRDSLQYQNAERSKAVASDNLKTAQEALTKMSGDMTKIVLSGKDIPEFMQKAYEEQAALVKTLGAKAEATSDAKNYIQRDSQEHIEAENEEPIDLTGFDNEPIINLDQTFETEARGGQAPVNSEIPPPVERTPRPPPSN